MADDDNLCNLALRDMLKKINKFEVLAFFNGLDVFCSF